MFIEYDEYELLELFESKAVSIYDEEAGKYMYVKTDKYGMKLILHIDVYEQTCSLSLTYEKYTKAIFEINETAVKRLIKKEATLEVVNNLDESVLKVYFRPNFSIKIL